MRSGVHRAANTRKLLSFMFSILKLGTDQIMARASVVFFFSGEFCVRFLRVYCMFFFF